MQSGSSWEKEEIDFREQVGFAITQALLKVRHGHAKEVGK